MAASQDGVTNLTGLQLGTGAASPYLNGSVYTGTPLYAASAVSFALPAHVVQGSASSFTVLAWPAARTQDVFLITPFGAGVSSLSSGLVLHSHCTQAGQVEVRLSNVSTLVQNQSAVTCQIARFSFF